MALQCVPCARIQSDTVGDRSREAALIFLTWLNNEAFSVLSLIVDVSFKIKLSPWLVLLNKVLLMRSHTCGLLLGCFTLYG